MAGFRAAVDGVAMGELRLEAREWQGAARWRWVLTTEPGGRFLADHEVRLDENCWQYEAFLNLQAYLKVHAAPDRRIERETEIVAQVGEWIGVEVFGAVGPAMVAQRPATVRVVVPAEAGELVFRPLELGHVRGRPLAIQNVTLAMHAGAAPPAGVMGERLRVLGLFSLPAGGRALNLRRERHALLRLFTEIAAVESRAIDVRVLQYGVTRDRLRDVLDEDEGWDIVHISGHGAPGELLLEAEDGSADRVGAGDLAGLLDVTRERLKLVTVSACWSAALTTAEQLRLLGLPAPAGPAREGPVHEGADERVDPPPDAVQPAALATELVDRLGCAVLAMRFPVVDDFAIDLAERLYGKLADKGHPLARAVGLALPEVLADPPTAACPPLSVATPALFGGRALNLRLRAPERTGQPSYDTELLKLAAFPEQPEWFVGRVAVMTRASAALAPRSGVSGVLLYGMPGAGKSACALELAYTHEHAFEKLVWFKAPDEGRDITGSLTDFALTLERALPGLQFVHLLEDPGKLQGFLPRLTKLCERRVLIVVDNAESLLTESGQWRDDRWGLLVAALAGHSGLGRLVMTSRRRPEGLDSRVALEPVDALSLDEALLLARELPHLRALLEGAVPGVDAAAAARLAAGVLEVAQGHPKLLELADGQAARPERLRELVRLAEAAWQEAGGLPEGFFATGETRAAGDDYLHVLHSWTSGITATLPAESHDLFFFLCCLEEGDRFRAVLDGNWGGLWGRLGREGAPPALKSVVGRLVAAGLVAAPPGPQDGAALFGVHPGVVAAGRQLAGQDFRSAVDTELGKFWVAVAQQAKRGGQDGGGELTGMVVRAGLGAAPYLMRLGRWVDAAGAVEHALTRDDSRTVVAAVVPLLQRIAQECAGTAEEPAVLGVLARALAEIDPGAAERLLREVLAAAVARHDYRSASYAAARLVGLCGRSGRLAEALRLADDQISYTQRAGLGPWTRLFDQARRLQVLAARGEAERVLAEAERLRAQMAGLSEASPQPETMVPWSVREVLLDTGREAARQLGQWEAALEWNAAVAASQRDRAAPLTQVARTRFHDYSPLLRLGRVDAAVGMLRKCREVFEHAHDVRGLGLVLGALADAEYQRGHGEVAIGLEQDALRYKYLAGDVAAIAVSHHNLGHHLRRSADDGRPAGGAVTHHLAAAVLCAVTGGDGLEDSVHAAAADIQVLGEETALLQDMAQLCGLVGQVPGVELDRLLTTLTGDLQAVQPILEQLTTQVRALASEKE